MARPFLTKAMLFTYVFFFFQTLFPLYPQHLNIQHLFLATLTPPCTPKIKFDTLTLTPKHQWRTFWLFAVLGRLL
jgi:hypothetical protein